MRYRGMAGLLAAVVLAACSPATPPAPTAAEDPAYAAAGAMACSALPGPDPARWLDGPGRPALAAEQIPFRWQRRPNGIRLTVGPDRLGLLRREGTQWWFTPEAGVDVSRRPAGAWPHPRRHRQGRAADAAGLRWRQGPAQHHPPGLRDALRVKHAEAPARRDFAGLQYWPGGADWQVQARFIAHPPGKTLPIVDITGLTTEMPNAGAVEFERDGRSWRLEAIGAPGQPLFLIFADRTSGAAAIR